MFRDVRFARRMLLKQPAFSLIAILTLALGIGATSAFFSLMQGVLLTPPPYRQPQRLVLIPPARPDGQNIAAARYSQLIFGEGFRLIASGVVAGIAVALLLSRVLRTFLFDVEPTDPATLLGVVLLFASVAVLACWVPTRRAAKVDPVEALRYE
jgi:ABC-type antimicrobial peptide transport system permease subunit